VPSVNDCSRTAPPPAPSGVAGMRRNHRLASIGIGGWFASESGGFCEVARHGPPRRPMRDLIEAVLN
jgi:hypothetical protein